jgi:UDPglucose 6-dehydrogenase
VTCVDRDARKVAALENGKIPIYEQGLEPVVVSNRQAGRLIFTEDLKAAVASADVVLIAVGTPTREGEDAADLSYVYAAGEEIAKAMQGYTVIVTKSTVPVGTAAKLREIISKARPDGDFDVASNPEFMREGSAVEDFLRPDRVVIGVNSERAEKVLRQLYRPLTAKNVPLLVASCEAAEVIKYAANTFLATRIAFVNQLADLCEALAPTFRTWRAAWASTSASGSSSSTPARASAAPASRRTRGHSSTRRASMAIPSPSSRMWSPPTRRASAPWPTASSRRRAESLAGKKIALLGIAFKAETDDIRDAAALTVIPELQKRGAAIAAFDPVAMDNGRQAFQSVQWCADAYSAALGADVVVVLTEWNVFRGLDLGRLARDMREPVMVDFRNLFTVGDVKGSGLVYHSIGRASVLPPETSKAAVIPFKSGAV